MSVSAIGAQSGLAIQQLVNMRKQFDDLQRQLSTGQKSTNYAGLGVNSGITVSLNAQLSAITGYNDTIDNVTTRINLMNNALGGMTASVQRGESRRWPRRRTAPTAPEMHWRSRPGKTRSTSCSACSIPGPATDYLFSGRATDQPPMDTLDHILNGDGARAGLKQLISERNQADLGASGLGRLVISAPTATSVADRRGLRPRRSASSLLRSPRT